MSRKEIVEAGKKTRIKKGQRLPGSGRPPNRVKEFKQDSGLTSTDIVNILKNVIHGHTIGELGLIAKDENEDALIRAFVRLYLEDFKTGRFQNIEKMLDRIIGKSKQTVDASVTLKSYKIIPAPELEEDDLTDGK